MEIKITKSEELKKLPNSDSLGFGSIFTDHMFVMEYKEGKGWYNGQIIPYGPILMDPATMVLHYGQETFEGLKAYRGQNDAIYLFRPEMNARRMNASNQRLCIPEIPEEDFVEAIRALVDVDRRWVPSGEGTSLYIRPFVYAIDPDLKVHPAKTYKFMVILSPVAAYYAEGINPVSIKVESEYVRAMVGGVGFAKTGGNYSASLLAQIKASEEGYSQVLWLDGKEHKYIEEVGTMNVFFVIDGILVTPELSGSILPGITRNSVITLAKDLGYSVKEAHISIDQLIEAYKNGQVSEAFGTGTAAVISPIGKLTYKTDTLVFNNEKTGPVALTLYEHITQLQTGEIEDRNNYRMMV